MFNILLDRLPEDYKGYLIRTDFRIYIQIVQCLDDDELTDEEKVSTALWLLYGMSQPPLEMAYQGLIWYLNFTTEPFENEYSKSSRRKETTKGSPCMSFDIDSGRIYTAFRRYYNVDLKSSYIHWVEFLYMLKDLGECAYTSVIDIRSKKITSSMGTSEKNAYRDLKEKYRLKPKLTSEQSKQIEQILAYKKTN